MARWPIELREGLTEPASSERGKFGWRRPVLYDPDEAGLYVGKPGAIHQEVMQEFGLHAHGLVHGLVNDGTQQHLPALKWFGKGPSPDDHLEIANVLGVSPDYEPMKWHLGAVPVTQNGGHVIHEPRHEGPFRTEEWREGDEGKAAWWDGQFHVWRTNTGYPHHMQVVQPLRLQNYGTELFGNLKIELPGGPGPDVQYHVGPDGALSSVYGPVPELDAQVPEPFHVKEPDNWWNLSKTGAVQNGGHVVENYLDSGKALVTEPWKPGDFGKGLLLNGELHLWNQGGFDPHHDGMFDHLRGQFDTGQPDAGRRWDDHYADLYKAPQVVINPSGEVMGGGAEQVAAMHPDLVFNPEASGFWRLGGNYSLTTPDDLPDVEGEDPTARWHRWRAHEDSAIKLHVGHGWSPGNIGKGVMVGGVPYVWNVSDTQGAPHHTAVINALGLDKPELEFGLAPSGEVDPHWWRGDQDEQMHKLFEADPRFTEKRTWLARTATRIVDVHPTETTRPGYDDRGDDQQVPLAYHPDDDVLYVGRPGWHHEQILHSLGLSDDLDPEALASTNKHWGDFNYGWVDTARSGGDGWYDLGQSLSDEQEDALTSQARQHLGLKPLQQDWHLGAAEHYLQWKPGTMGKGLLDGQGRVYTVTTSGGRFAWYSHADLANALGVHDLHPNGAVYISPDGTVDAHADITRHFTDADPRLRGVGPDWSKLAAEHRLGWDPSLGWGKGIVDEQDNVHTWPTYGQDQHPWHQEYARDNGVDPRSFFVIEPSGSVLKEGEHDIDDGDKDLIQQADPRLSTEHTDWTL